MQDRNGRIEKRESEGGKEEGEGRETHKGRSEGGMDEGEAQREDISGINLIQPERGGGNDDDEPKTFLNGRGDGWMAEHNRQDCMHATRNSATENRKESRKKNYFSKRPVTCLIVLLQL